MERRDWLLFNTRPIGQGNVAQWARRWTSDPNIAGSSPATIIWIHHQCFWILNFDDRSIFNNSIELKMAIQYVLITLHLLHESCHDHLYPSVLKITALWWLICFLNYSIEFRMANYTVCFGNLTVITLFQKFEESFEVFP